MQPQRDGDDRSREHGDEHRISFSASDDASRDPRRPDHRASRQWRRWPDGTPTTISTTIPRTTHGRVGPADSESRARAHRARIAAIDIDRSDPLDAPPRDHRGRYRIARLSHRERMRPVNISVNTTPERVDVGADIGRSRQRAARAPCRPECRRRRRGASAAYRRRRTAMPKSTTLTAPPGVIRTFSGFRSRCTTPASCAAHSARAISARDHGARPGRAAAFDLAAQRVPLDEFRGDEQATVDLLERIDGGHRRDARWSRPRAPRAAAARAARDRIVQRRQRLQRDAAVQAAVARAR